MNDTLLSIQDLSDQTGLPRRTIHFYIQQEILPPAEGSGLGAFYRHEHLVRLKLIPILRRQGLRLDDIRLRFQALRTAELEDLLARSDKTPPPAPRSAPPQPIPATPYQAYTLPYGLILMAPHPLPAEIQGRFERLLISIQSDFQENA